MLHTMEGEPYVYLQSFWLHRKDVLYLAFYLKWKKVCSDPILLETINISIYPAVFSNIYHKIKFTAIIWSNLGNFYL